MWTWGVGEVQMDMWEKEENIRSGCEVSGIRKVVGRTGSWAGEFRTDAKERDRDGAK